MDGKILWIKEPLTEALDLEFELICVDYCEVETNCKYNCKNRCGIVID